MVIIGPKLPFLYPLVDPNQQVPGYILTIVYALSRHKEMQGLGKNVYQNYTVQITKVCIVDDTKTIMIYTVFTHEKVKCIC